jgi:hypothetical protein
MAKYSLLQMFIKFVSASVLLFLEHLLLINKTFKHVTIDVRLSIFIIHDPAIPKPMKGGKSLEK